MEASGQQLPPASRCRRAQTVHTVVHATIDYHDFNAPVTVTVPVCRTLVAGSCSRPKGRAFLRRYTQDVR